MMNQPALIMLLGLGLQLAAILLSAVIIWTRLRATVKWHSDWIHQHEIDGKQRDATLQEAVQANVRLTTLTEQHENRIERLERQQDR